MNKQADERPTASQFVARLEHLLSQPAVGHWNRLRTLTLGLVAATLIAVAAWAAMGGFGRNSPHDDGNESWRASVSTTTKPAFLLSQSGRGDGRLIVTPDDASITFEKLGNVDAVPFGVLKSTVSLRGKIRLDGETSQGGFFVGLDKDSKPRMCLALILAYQSGNRRKVEVRLAHYTFSKRNKVRSRGKLTLGSIDVEPGQGVEASCVFTASSVVEVVVNKQRFSPAPEEVAKWLRRIPWPYKSGSPFGVIAVHDVVFSQLEHKSTGRDPVPSSVSDSSSSS